MNDDGRNILDAKIRDGWKAIDDAISEMQKYFAIFERARKDTYAFQLALQAWTRDSSDPYKPRQLPDIHFGVSGYEGHLDGIVLASGRRVNLEALVQPKKEAQDADDPLPPLKKKFGKPLDVSLDSPTGIVRSILRSVNGEMSIDAILAAVPEAATAGISREIVYRIVPRMQERGEIVRTGRGTYRYNKDFEGTEEE